MQWDYEEPFTLEKTVAEADIDLMGHTNNVVYLKWLEEVAWLHSSALGLGWSEYQRLNRGMVARRHELDYLRATFVGDALVLATWIIENPGKTGIVRAYQVVRRADEVTVLRGLTRWVCVNIETGKPQRMPPEFVQGYRVSQSLK